jgi:NAD(P)-dependent dehydrogenase (short-subunit alcohol dehydrogenase family)
MPKTILLTGASKGLGLATLQILLSSSPSPRVISISRSLPQPLLALRDQYPDNLELVQGDVAERATSEEALERIEKRWPGKGLDGLLLNAGVLEPLGRIGEVDV